MIITQIKQMDWKEKLLFYACILLFTKRPEILVFYLLVDYKKKPWLVFIYFKFINLILEANFCLNDT